MKKLSRWMVAAALLAGSAVGCATEQPFVWVQSLPAADPSQPVVVAPRDSLLVVVKNQQALSGSFVVGDDGTYLQPTLGAVQASGKTVGQIAGELHTRLGDIVVNPDVTVAIDKAAPIRISVVGEVKTPGSYELTRDQGVLRALAAAGWLTDFADRDRIFVLRAGRVEPRIRFRTRDLTAAEDRSTRFRLHDGDTVVVE
ncbi:MAG TPA: polysaccharide biosynthesis/export family protein [Polyangia bacterium]|nr:polysaccharide biosynthesis/export family protein [Polyangia bacterium]HVZ85327.1 polysaccharide biosynthesis/export family protein [Polyangia bacterium]